MVFLPNYRAGRTVQLKSVVFAALSVGVVMLIIVVF